MNVPIQPLAVLTGATGGIGRELVRQLVEAGYRIAILSRRAVTVSAEFPAFSSAQLTPIACDLILPADIQRASAEVLSQGQPIQLLIHCAGITHPETAESIRGDSLLAQVGINLTAPMLLTTQLLPGMPRGAHILFVNSMAGALPLPGNSIYSATKFGLRGFARSLALDLAPRGISVSSIFPGAVDTPMLRKEMAENGSELNFTSPPSTVAEIAECLVKLSRGPSRERFWPRLDGLFSQACLVMPWLLRLTLPLLSWFGHRGLSKFNREQTRTKPAVKS